MSVFDVLDATRVCSRWSEPLSDPSVWVLPAPPVKRREALPERDGVYSWRSLARNPRAMLVTGMAAPLLAAEAVRRTLAAPAP
jgi:hypothetical protein